jgi:hypothetical protein
VKRELSWTTLAEFVMTLTSHDNIPRSRFALTPWAIAFEQEEHVIPVMANSVCIWVDMRAGTSGTAVLSVVDDFAEIDFEKDILGSKVFFSLFARSSA